MGKRGLLGFVVIQTAGCVFASYGTVYSESAFARASWLLGFLLLLPGNLAAQATIQVLIHVRTAYVFIPVTVASNAILWIACSWLWHILRRSAPKEASFKYGFAFALTALMFVVANAINFLRPITCFDCFFPYGVPFTIYHDGGFAGGAGVAWAGLAADAACVGVAALVVARLWETVAGRREQLLPGE
jgi:hypothetical protein